MRSPHKDQIIRRYSLQHNQEGKREGIFKITKAITFYGILNRKVEALGMKKGRQRVYKKPYCNACGSTVTHENNDDGTGFIDAAWSTCNGCKMYWGFAETIGEHGIEVDGELVAFKGEFSELVKIQREKRNVQIRKSYKKKKSQRRRKK